VQSGGPENVILRILIFSLSAFAVGGFGMYRATRKAEWATRRSRWIKFITYFCIVHLVLLCALLGRAVLSVLVLAILSVGAFELYHALFDHRRVPSMLRAGACLAYLLLAAGLMFFVLVSTAEAVVFVYVVVAAFDGFSQVTGQLIGRRQLARIISPAKTVEGAIGGLAMAAVTALVLRPLVRMNAGESLALCGWIVLAGLCGDLAASWIKRQSGLKDFGRLLPGHGGILDRFDSFLVAGPAALIWMSRLSQ
jgi:phosphatidate cytidylyltransferase